MISTQRARATLPRGSTQRAGAQVPMGIDAEGKGKASGAPAASGANDWGPEWYIQEFGYEFSVITTMWQDVIARLVM